jgi:hypothetical protein
MPPPLELGGKGLVGEEHRGVLVPRRLQDNRDALGQQTLVILLKPVNLTEP